MGDPIIIWLPGTVFDYSGACQQYMQDENYYACNVEPVSDGEGVYVSCCFPGG